ncbi:MAG: class I SAM-dependent methyltransferase [Verrucomicrobiota bacterium]
MSNNSPSNLQKNLRLLYQIQLPSDSAWKDRADASFLGVHLIERSIAGLAGELKGDLLDVGCGEQPYRNYFQHAKKKVACDFDAKRGDVDFACPAHAIPVASESFDAILCTEVLEHVPDPLAVWREFHRVLRPNGRVLLSTPMYWPPHELPYDFYRYPEQGLRHLATTAGFEVRELWPRGGRWALFGQLGMHVLHHYFRPAFLRRFWNNFFLSIDRRRNNPDLTMGWTILAEKV